MTILAGIFSRNKDHPLDDAICKTLKGLISRNPEDKVLVFSDPRCFLAKIDISAYGEAAFHRDLSWSVSQRERTKNIGSAAVASTLFLLEHFNPEVRLVGCGSGV